MLTVISTPIGNIADISIRAIKALFSVDILLCEDTRRTGMLLEEIKKRYADLFLSAVDTSPQLVSFYDEIEFKKLPEIILWLDEGKHIGLVSDNGMPGISDPGFRVVSEARKRHMPVTVLPGPNAAITALVGSGFATHMFTFLGFLPEKEGAQKKLLQKTLESTRSLSSTYIFYCAPHKLIHTLGIMNMVFGDIQIGIARELTKVHEEYWRGTISEALIHFTDPKGEIVVLFRLSE
jgi:16S rRNA (cytidine1402-2'-O)-methyltransferase